MCGRGRPHDSRSGARRYSRPLQNQTVSMLKQLPLGQFGKRSVYALTMRFRQKFGWIGWMCLGFVCLYSFQLMADSTPEKRAVHTFCLICWSFGAIVRASGSFFVYFKIEPDGLCCKDFWRTKHFAWGELTRIGSQPGSILVPEVAKVQYLRRTPFPDIGKFQIMPKNPKGLIEALREQAPQAEFDA